MLYFIQAVIIFAVCWHNAVYHWTPNILLPGLIGVGLAYLVTRVYWELQIRWRARREIALQRKLGL